MCASSSDSVPGRLPGATVHSRDREESKGRRATHAPSRLQFQNTARHQPCKEEKGELGGFVGGERGGLFHGCGLLPAPEMLLWLRQDEMSVQELLQRVQCVITHVVSPFHVHFLLHFFLFLEVG
uniref:Uncharacterized protein n=1 Tax=Knipowitschia caucasica TaxID=637954 RepID=A0AAV2KSZ7_KNICA